MTTKEMTEADRQWFAAWLRDHDVHVVDVSPEGITVEDRNETLTFTTIKQAMTRLHIK